jgi:hypothetical protein
MTGLPDIGNFVLWRWAVIGLGSVAVDDLDGPRDGLKVGWVAGKNQVLVLGLVAVHD